MKLLFLINDKFELARNLLLFLAVMKRDCYVIFKKPKIYRTFSKYYNIQIDTDRQLYLMGRSKQVTNFTKFIEHIDPDALIMFSYRIKHNEFSAICREHGVKTIFIAHGISIHEDLQERRLQKCRINFYNDHIDIAFLYSDKECMTTLEKKVDTKCRFVSLKSSPTIDYLLRLDKDVLKTEFYERIYEKQNDMIVNKHNPDNKTILFVHSCDGDNSPDELLLILSELQKYTPQYNIIVRTKKPYLCSHKSMCCAGYRYNEDKTYKDTISEIHLNPQIIMSCRDTSLFYELLFCDVIIIQGFSTASLETVIANPKTLYCKILNNRDMYVKEEDGLLTCNSVVEFNYMLSSLISSNMLLTDKYVKNRKEFIENIYPSIGKVIDTITSHIT